MKQNRPAWARALLIVLTGLAGAGLIMTVPALFRSPEGAAIWPTVLLGGAFIALAGVTLHQSRRLHTSDD